MAHGAAFVVELPVDDGETCVAGSTWKMQCSTSKCPGQAPREVVEHPPGVRHPDLVEDDVGAEYWDARGDGPRVQVVDVDHAVGAEHVRADLREVDASGTASSSTSSDARKSPRVRETIASETPMATSASARCSR